MFFPFYIQLLHIKKLPYYALYETEIYIYLRIVREHMFTSEQMMVKDYIQKWGGSNSHALLDPTCFHYVTDEIQGIIGYRIESKCAIVFGDPICHPDDSEKFIEKFHTFCKINGKTPIYVGISKKFSHLSLANKYGSLIQFGDEIILNPLIDAKLGKGKHASLLRNKYNQSIKSGFEVKEYVGDDIQLENKILEVTQAWLQNRKGAQIALLNVNIFCDRSIKRWFYAQKNGKIIGLAMINRLDAHDGWVLNLLVKSPEAPTSISEFIILETLAALAKEQCTFFSIGSVPASDLGKMIGFGYVSTILARSIYKIARKIFNLSNRQRFWKKFKPINKPVYLLFCNSKVRIREIIALLRAFKLSMG